mmetsp:Transcript_50357/g.96175  ORF Transcript_50357/g.96175 Transcript_50357/m.96175 type:complete len:219 (-) Transcript_50357:345-1001(-)
MDSRPDWARATAGSQAPWCARRRLRTRLLEAAPWTQAARATPAPTGPESAPARACPRHLRSPPPWASGTACSPPTTSCCPSACPGVAGTRVTRPAPPGGEAPLPAGPAGSTRARRTRPPLPAASARSPPSPPASSKPGPPTTNPAARESPAQCATGHRLHRSLRRRCPSQCDGQPSRVSLVDAGPRGPPPAWPQRRRAGAREATCAPPRARALAPSAG